jgi:hypothetical protein
VFSVKIILSDDRIFAVAVAIAISPALTEMSAGGLESLLSANGGGIVKEGVDKNDSE